MKTETTGPGEITKHDFVSSNSATAAAHKPAPLWLVISAFAAVYLIWGSTYLGIRYAVESIPPFLMAGARHLAAGLGLYVFRPFSCARSCTFVVSNGAMQSSSAS